MNYLTVRWKHSLSTEPVLLYSEIDDDRWERRKVEVFRDGRQGYANSDEAIGSTRLGLEPLPELNVIASDKQFEPMEISKEEFERVWTGRGGRPESIYSI